MSRTRQYPRWKRMALQVVMCCVLGASVVTATYVSKARRPATVALGRPEAHGRLKYALPVGWSLKSDPTAFPGSVVARELSGGKRSVFVWHDPLADDAEPVSLLERILHTQGIPEHRLEPFKLAGQEGMVVAIYPQDYPEEAANASPGLFAAAVLPNGSGVVIGVRGPSAYGPSGRDLLRKLADSVTLNPAQADAADNESEAE